MRSALRSHVWFCCLAGLLLLSIGPVQAQPSDWDGSVSVRGLASTGSNMPFWLRANQYGTVDSTSANGIVRLAAARSFGLGPTSVEVGGELLGRASAHASLHAHEWYARLQYRDLWLQAGQREEPPTGLSDPTLSLGSMGRSRNAPPLPKIAIGSDSYLSVPGTNDVLAVKGYLAHGWFPDDRYVRGPYLHEKYAYLRIFSRDAPIQLHAGGLQHTIWGGVHPTLGAQPADFGAVLRVFGGLSGSQEAPERDQKGTIGATEAGYDFAITAQRFGWEARISRYFHHTDKPSLYFRNPWDGLWEVRLQRPDTTALLTTVLWEHLSATRHNAKYSQGQTRGADSYYNNGAYRSGWTYRGFTLGSPLLLTNPTGPGVHNNIVLAHHVALQGYLLPELRYTIMGTYSRHYGAQSICPTPSCSTLVNDRTGRTDQYSGLVRFTHSMPPLTVRTALSADLGALFEDRVGVSVGLTWSL